MSDENAAVFFAPHCFLPPRDGASLRAVEIARAYRSAHGSAWLITKSAICRVHSDGREEVVTPLPNKNSSLGAATRALLTGEHYLQSKHLDPAWRKAVAAWLAKARPAMLYAHFLWSWDFLASLGLRCPTTIDTHNFDLEWFRNLRANSRNPLKRHLCQSSADTISRILRELPRDVRLVHVSERDAEAYREIRSDLDHRVLPNGCRVQPRLAIPSYAAPRKQLYFLGLLSVQIALDALLHFEKHFWPALKDVADFHVLGAHPTKAVRQLCERHGWSLRADLTEEALAEATATMHYACLPFAYGAGSKLKFADACGRGLPVLATPAGVKGFDGIPATALVSDEPQTWRAEIVGRQFFTAAEAEEALRFARRYSWPSLVRTYFASEALALAAV